MNKLLPFRSVLIFGGSGFIGSNWASYLLDTTEARIHIFDNLSRPGVEENLRWLRRKSRDPERLKFTLGDVRDSAAVTRAVQGATEIYHLAAQVAVTSSVDNPQHDFEINALGTLNVLEAARKSGRQPFILFTSTNKVYGDLANQQLVTTAKRYSAVGEQGVNESQPLDLYSPYGCSKGAADQYVHDYSRIFGLPTVVFRMSCIAGGRQFGNEDQGWVAHFVYSALENSPIAIYGNGRQVRDVLSVRDLVLAFEKVRDQTEKTAGQIYNVGGGPANAVSLLEVMEEIESVTGQRIRFTFQAPRPGDQLFYVTDFAKLSRHTGWKPERSLRQTIQDIYEWSNERPADRELVAIPALGRPLVVGLPEAAS